MSADSLKWTTDCASSNEIKAREPIRCRECGCRVMYKKRVKRSEQLLNLPRDWTTLTMHSSLFPLSSRAFSLIFSGASFFLSTFVSAQRLTRTLSPGQIRSTLVDSIAKHSSVTIVARVVSSKQSQQVGQRVTGQMRRKEG